jgi:hypothetical protein
MKGIGANQELGAPGGVSGVVKIPGALKRNAPFQV